VAVAVLAAPSSASATPDVADRVSKYTPRERAIVTRHLQRATSRIAGRHTEFKVAAAVNTYLHQYIHKTDNLGEAPKILADGYGACGGSVAAMLDMLHIAGIEAAHAYTLGVAWGGNHSMVEVQFRGGRRGLFDPYHGAFWRDRKRRPVRLGRLINKPASSDRALFTDRYSPPEIPAGAVVPLRSIRDGYRRDKDGVERTSTGRLWMDWEDMFADNRGWGVAYSGVETRTVIPITAGALYGTHAPGGSGVRPWVGLAGEDDPTGRNLAWPYVIGYDNGTTTAHDFAITGTPGELYTLVLSYAQAIRKPVLTAEVNGVERHIQLDEFWYGEQHDRVEVVEIPFRQTGPDTLIAMRANGYVLFQGIEVRRQADPPGVGRFSRLEPPLFAR
jgi:hypothetical protein